jgi:hypothetical protein
MNTVMVKNLETKVVEESFRYYCGNPSEHLIYILNSVESPHKRYIINTKALKIEKVTYDKDAISPPPLLNKDDSMGTYVLDEKDKEYGEAVVEVRSIRKVGSWFLKTAKLNLSVTGQFLTQPTKILIVEAVALYNFLGSFGEGRYTEDIKVGLTHAIFKY